MLIVAVDSSVFATVGFDEAQQLLRLDFRRGEVYQYYGVPASVFEALLAAPSQGRYFHQAILGRYRFVRIPCASSMPLSEQGGATPWHVR